MLSRAHSSTAIPPAVRAASQPCFDFGGVTVEIACEEGDFLRLVEDRYVAFATDAPSRWQVRYRVVGPRSPAPEFIYSARQQIPTARRDGSILHLETPTFEMTVERDSGAVDLSGPLATYPVDRLIQTLCYETLCHEADDRGLILHAAALAEGDRGFLMSGPSGCGKSTLAKLFPDRALCDEFAAVILGKSPPRLAALPFWKSRRGSAALHGIYLPRHGRTDRRRRLASGEALDRLRREVVWPTFDDELLHRAFDTLFDLVAAVPVWELAFRPGTEIWQIVDREAAR